MLFFDNVFQCPTFKAEIGKHLLQTTIFVLRSLIFLISAASIPPYVVAGFGNNGLTTHIFDGPGRFDGLQDGDDLVLGESDLTHSDLLRGHNQYVGRSIKVNGPFCRDTYNSPYGTTGNPSIWISVTGMQSDRRVIQTVRDNTATQSGYRRQISSSGSVGPWVQELTSRTDATTQHMSSRTPNAYNVGGVSNAYANGYFQNAITVVSDRNHKPIEEAVPDKALDIWGRISPKRYKYDWAIEEKGAEGARWHVGWIAQDILEAFAEAGEDATEWALITYNEWDENDGIPAGHQWRLVMDECLALETLYKLRRLTKIEYALA